MAAFVLCYRWAENLMNKVVSDVRYILSRSAVCNLRFIVVFDEICDLFLFCNKINEAITYFDWFNP